MTQTPQVRLFLVREVFPVLVLLVAAVAAFDGAVRSAGNGDLSAADNTVLRPLPAHLFQSPVARSMMQ